MNCAYNNNQQTTKNFEIPSIETYLEEICSLFNPSVDELQTFRDNLIKHEAMLRLSLEGNGPGINGEWWN